MPERRLITDDKEATDTEGTTIPKATKAVNKVILGKILKNKQNEGRLQETFKCSKILLSSELRTPQYSLL